MKVSVCMITYNHESFISEAIESVLMQQTNFDYELVIGEDCSTDRTREICLQYQAKYPDKIKLRLPEKNMGMQPNVIANLKACTGEYIAMLEGDDYWIDPLKLQKQVDFLEKNPELIACFHDVINLNDNEGLYYESPRVFGNRKIFDINDIVSSWFINTCSLVFRNLDFQLPAFMSEVYAGDQFLSLTLAMHGKFYYFNDAMAVYRVHATGVTRAFVAKDRKREVEKLKSGFIAFDKFSGLTYHKIIKKRIKQEELIYNIEKTSFGFKKFFLVINFIFLYSSWRLREVKNIVHRFYPNLYRFYPFKRAAYYAR